MDGIFYTLQDFFTHTKGMIYVLMVVSLLAIAGFWNFLSDRDEKKYNNEIEE